MQISTPTFRAELCGFARHVLPLVERGSVRPVIDQIYPAAEVRAAHKHLESDKALGKIVLDFSRE